MKRIVYSCFIAVLLLVAGEKGYGINISFSVQPSSCGAPDGEISATASNGAAPYNFLWSNGSTCAEIKHALPGNYVVTVTDNNGVTATDSVILTANTDLTFEVKSHAAIGTTATGFIEVEMLGGIPPYNISSACSGWTPSISVSNDSGFALENLNGYSPAFVPGMGCNPLASGIEYIVNISDASGCSGQFSKTIKATGFYTSPGTSASCGLAGTGKIHDTLHFNDPAFNFHQTGFKLVVKSLPFAIPVDSVYIHVQSPGNPFQVFSYELDSLSAGDYLLEYYLEDLYAGVPGVYQSNTFHNEQVSIFNLGLSCGNVGGAVFFDANGNCIKDAGEMPLINSVVEIQPGNHFTITDSNGFYEYSLPLGNYSIRHTPAFNAELTTICPASQPFQFVVNTPQQFITIHFADSSAGKDLSTDIQLSSMVPGSPAYILVSIANISASPTYSDTLNVYFDTALTVLNSEPEAFFSGQGELKFVIDSLPSFTRSQFMIRVMVDAAAIVGNNITVESELVTTTDIDTGNNSDIANRSVGNTIYSTRKTVSPTGFGDLNYLPNSEVILEYLIEFQNTGNDTATSIFVADSISDFLDLSTFTLLYSTIDYDVTISENLVTLSNETTMLPDSTSDEEHSRGYIAYRILQKNDNPAGSEITGSTSVTFNNNSPLVADTCLLTLYDCDSLFTSLPVNILACENSTITFGTTTSLPCALEWYYDGLLVSTTSSITIPSIVAGQHDVIAQAITPYCSGIQNYSVNAATLPDAIISVNGDTLTTDPINASYQWFLEGIAIPGAIDPTYVAVATGNYTVQVTSFIGCLNTSTPVYVSITGIGTLAANGVAMFPNPGSTELNLMLPSVFTGTTEIFLYSMDGRMQEIYSTADAVTTLNTSALLPGIYQVVIQNNGKSYSGRWIRY